MNKRDLISEMLLTGYKIGGRGPDVFDCYGMGLHVCERMGWKCPPDHEGDIETRADILAAYASGWAGGEWRQCEPMDGAWIFAGSLERARHSGIIIDGGMLHTVAPMLGHRGGPRWEPLRDIFNRTEKYEVAKWVG